jgi:arsenate reductase
MRSDGDRQTGSKLSSDDKIIGSKMKKIYFLSTCSTCKEILKDIQPGKKGFQLQDIKTEKITPVQLDEMKKKAGSYEALFSRRA